MPLTNQELTAWFEEYKEFTSNLSARTSEAELQAIKTLLDNFREKKVRLDEFDKKHTPDYNLFFVLECLLHDEDRLHSPFLADLLNIKGKHKQGKLFYNSFIELILSSEERKQKFFGISTNYFTLTKEKWTGNGFIDIFIEYNHPSLPFGIAIENKIYAKDQEEQLKRYNDYLKRRFNNDYLLIYLTPKERVPDEKSICKEDCKSLIHSGHLLLITYQAHIKKLLENSLIQIKSRDLKFIINQYLTLIKNDFLYGQSNV